MFLTFSEVFFTNAIGVNNDSCGGSQNSFQERCSCNITNISRSIRTGISTQTYSNFFRFYWFLDVSLFSVLRIRVRRTYDTFNTKRTKVKRNLMCTITCRKTQHLVSSCRSKGPFIFYGVEGAGGIWKSVIWKLYDPPPQFPIFSHAPPPHQSNFLEGPPPPPMNEKVHKVLKKLLH